MHEKSARRRKRMVQEEQIKRQLRAIVASEHSQLGESEIEELCGFVYAALEIGSYYYYDGYDVSLKREEYKRLKRRRNEVAKQSFYYLNLLLLVYDCYNVYAHTQPIKGKFVKLKVSIERAIHEIQEHIECDKCHDMLEETVDWLINYEIIKSLQSEQLNEKQYKDIRILVKHYDAQNYLKGNHINRFFYDFNKYSEKKLTYFIPVIKGDKSECRKIKEAVFDAFIQNFAPMKDKIMASKYKQTIYCTPIYIANHPANHPANPLVKKVR